MTFLERNRSLKSKIDQFYRGEVLVEADETEQIIAAEIGKSRGP